MSPDTAQWSGHPWATQEHRPSGTTRRAWCSFCNTWCYPDHGCLCCCEPAYAWLIAQAEWRAERAQCAALMAEPPGPVGGEP